MVDYNICPFCSSRVASRGITLADAYSDESYGINALGNNGDESIMTAGAVSSSTGRENVSALSRLRRRLYALWLSAVQRWPAVT